MARPKHTKQRVAGYVDPPTKAWAEHEAKLSGSFLSTIISQIVSSAHLRGVPLALIPGLIAQAAQAPPLVRAPTAFALPAKKPGYVYVIRAGDYFKIGRTGNVDSRLAQIRTACPLAAGLVMAQEVADPIRLEAELHKEFALHRVHGEWFVLGPEALARIRSRLGGAP